MKIDVSHHQGIINWEELKKSTPELDGVYIKTTQGVGYTDPLCIQHSVGAASQKLPVGYYHFASLNTTTDIEKDATSEADYFSLVIKNLRPTTLPLVLDIEENKALLTKPQVLQWINAFFKRLREHGYANVSLYSYTAFLDSNLPPQHNLGNIPLWIAQYVNKPAPKLPKGWTKAWLWQYSCTGTLPGIKGKVDLNKSL